jgi:hypothetical protein
MRKVYENDAPIVPGDEATSKILGVDDRHTRIM